MRTQGLLALTQKVQYDVQLMQSRTQVSNLLVLGREEGIDTKPGSY